MRLLLAALMAMVCTGAGPTSAPKSAKCAVGDPLCTDIDTSPTVPASKKPAPVPKKQQPAPGIKLLPQKHQTAAPSLKKAPPPSGTPQKDAKGNIKPPYSETFTGTPTGVNQEVRFDDDALAGATHPGDRIKVRVVENKPDVKCFKPSSVIFNEMYPGEVEEVKDPPLWERPEFIARLDVEYRSSLKCVDECMPDDEIAFLAECINWKEVLEKQIAQPACSGAKLREAFRSGKYKRRMMGADGKCTEHVASEVRRSGRVKNDIVLLVDNSGSMLEESDSIVPIITEAIAKKTKSLGTNTNLILMTQSLDQKPVVLPVSDPNFLAKAKTIVAGYFSAYDSDAEERPLLALKRNLPKVARKDAALNVIVLTDEEDSSTMKQDPKLNADASAEQYVASLSSLTQGKFTLNSTEPTGSRWRDSEYPLRKAALLTGGQNLDLTPSAFKANMELVFESGQESHLALGPLPANTDPETLVVVWDGRELDPSEYEFDAKKRMVRPRFKYDPKSKHEVKLSYLTLRTEEPGPVASSRADNDVVPSWLGTAEKKKYSSWKPSEKDYYSWVALSSEVPAESRAEHRAHVVTRVREDWPFYRKHNIGKPLEGKGVLILLGHVREGVLELGDLDKSLHPGWLTRAFEADWQKESETMIRALGKLKKEQQAEALLTLNRKHTRDKLKIGSPTTDLDWLRVGLQFLEVDSKKCDLNTLHEMGKWIQQTETREHAGFETLRESLLQFLGSKHFTMSLECSSDFCKSHGACKKNGN